MGRTRLFWFRLLTPGALAIFFALTLFNPGLNAKRLAEIFHTWEGLVVAACVLVGLPYRIYDARNFLLGQFFTTVNVNIADRLLAIVRQTRALTGEQEQYLRSDRRLMQVFYRMVDNDESLKAKAAGIYFNGYLTTLGVDIATVSALAAAAHLAFWLITTVGLHVKWAFACELVALVGWAISRRAVRRHMDLSNEQLSYIGNFYADRVRDSVDSILRNMPP